MKTLSVYVPTTQALSGPGGWSMLEPDLARCRGLGFAGIQLGPPLPGDDPAQVRDLADQAGLTIATAWLDLAGSSPFQEDSVPYLTAFDQQLVRVAATGARTLVLDSGAAPAAIATTQEKAARVATIRIWTECARRAADRGVRLAWEIRPDRAFNKPSQIVEVVESVAEPNFGVLFDPGHAHEIAGLASGQIDPIETLAGGRLELLGRLVGSIAAIQVPTPTVCDDKGAGPASGLETLVAALLDSGMPTEWWGLDPRASDDPWSAAARARDVLESLLVAEAT